MPQDPFPVPRSRARDAAAAVPGGVDAHGRERRVRRPPPGPVGPRCRDGNKKEQVRVSRHLLARGNGQLQGINVNGVAKVSLSWFNSAGAYLGETSSSPLPSGNPSWTQLAARTRVPPGAAAVQLFLKSYGVAGTVWFDDVHITVSP